MDRTLVVAATPWSGNRRLARLLALGGGVPAPRSWFIPSEVPALAQRLGVAVDETNWPARYLSAVRGQATDSGRCSIAVMWSHHRWLVRVARMARDLGPEATDGVDPASMAPDDPSIVAAWFPAPSYLWLRSRDARAQALRWYASRHLPIARGQVGRGPDFQEVRWLESVASRQDKAWETHFRIHRIEPTVVWQEDLADSPVETVRSAGLTLGWDLGNFEEIEPGESEVSPSEVERVAEEWAGSYRSARRKLSSIVGARVAPPPAPADRA